MTYGNSKLSNGLYKNARTDIIFGNFHLYRPVARTYQPVRKRCIRAVVDRMIQFDKILPSYVT